VDTYCPANAPDAMVPVHLSERVEGKQMPNVKVDVDEEDVAVEAVMVSDT